MEDGDRVEVEVQKQNEVSIKNLTELRAFYLPIYWQLNGCYSIYHSTIAILLDYILS